MYKYKNILSLTSKDALDFFMKSEQFHSFELPEYFNFDKVLAFVKSSIGNKKYESCLTDVIPDNLSDVNLEILLNKDGRYAVRPLVIANPFLYYFLAREICNPTGWDAILKCFKTFTVPHITSCAMPIVPPKAEPFHKSTTILNWWNAMEQRSLELSLEYRYMFVTDITNCYGSINPQSIEWALSYKNTKYENFENQQLAENIQKYLRALQHGHNIGIPQGSALFDFIGEIVLGYSDLLLHEALQKEKIKGYEILRYRDDYRVFCNDKNTLEHISYMLQNVLECLNFRMNSQKTKISDTVIVDSIKPDKLFYIYNTPIFNKKGVDFDSFEKHLLFILMYARQFPNGGQLKVLLSDIDKRIEEWLAPKEMEIEVLNLENERKKKTIEIHRKKLTGGSVRAMCAVATQIALDNVSIVHYALRIISRMADSLDDMKEKQDIINKVYDRLCNQPNSDYNQLWLQNMTYTRDKKRKISPYTMRLCKLVIGNIDKPLWNNGWINAVFVKNMPIESIVDKETLKKVTPVITFRETRAYNDYI